MGKTCCVLNCRLSWDLKLPNIKFHGFPSQECYRKEWISILEKYSSNEILSTKNVCVCSRHFNDCDYFTDTKKLIKGSFPKNFEPILKNSSSTLGKSSGIEQQPIQEILMSLEVKPEILHEETDMVNDASLAIDTSSINLFEELKKSQAKMQAIEANFEADRKILEEKLKNSEAAKIMMQKLMDEREKIHKNRIKGFQHREKIMQKQLQKSRLQNDKRKQIIKNIRRQNERLRKKVLE